MNFSIEAGTICSYGKMLAAEERSAGTIEKYLRDVRAFASWLGGRALNKEETAGWKQHLLAQGYTPVTVNSMLSALNRFFHFIGRDECRVRFLRIQRRVFRDPTRDLGRDDYERLLQAAETSGNIRLKLLMETICATGIRVSDCGSNQHRTGANCFERKNPYDPAPGEALSETEKICSKTKHSFWRDLSYQ